METSYTSRNVADHVSDRGHVSKGREGPFQLGKNTALSETRRGGGKSVCRGRDTGRVAAKAPCSPPSSLALLEGVHFVVCKSHHQKGESKKAVTVSRAPGFPQSLEE